MIRVRALRFVLPLLALGLVGAARGPLGTPSDSLALLRQDLLGMIRAPGWRTAEWGVLAVSLDRGDTLFAENPDLALAPASNMKLLTTAVAMEVLGADFRYQTFVLGTGTVQDGVLSGDLVLYGTGDPSISDRFFPSSRAALDSLAASLAALGIRTVEGDVVGDGTFFEGLMIGPDWNPLDLNDWFAAPVSALGVNENVLSIRVQPARYSGLRPLIETFPDHAAIDLLNGALTVGGGPSSPLGIGRARPEDPIIVEGQMALGAHDAWREMTVSDPELFAATLFAAALEARGIDVTGRPRSEPSPQSSPVSRRSMWAPAITGNPAPRVLATHLSPPLADLVVVVNRESHNLYAEAILKTLGRVMLGDGSFEGGASAVAGFLADRVGVPSEGLDIIDGSGLSRTNRVSAHTFVSVLEHMTRSPSWEPFWASLPEAGNRRQLSRMFRTPAAGNLRAKTGTIARVSALSGIVRSATGERIAFSILSNNVPSSYRAKQIEDRIGARLASFSRGDEPPSAPGA